AAEVAFALYGAVQNGIADNDRFFRNDTGEGIRPDDQPAARQAFADVIVGFADQVERYAARHPGSEALPRGTFQRQPNRIVWQPLVSVALGDDPREHGANRSVGVLDRDLRADGFLFLERWPAQLDELVV